MLLKINYDIIIFVVILTLFVLFLTFLFYTLRKVAEPSISKKAPPATLANSMLFSRENCLSLNPIIALEIYAATGCPARQHLQCGAKGVVPRLGFDGGNTSQFNGGYLLALPDDNAVRRRVKRYTVQVCGQL